MFAVLVLVLIPVVFASVDIQIKTLPDHRISVIIRESGNLASLDSFHIETEDGDVEISSDVSKTEVDLIITLKKGIKEILRKDFLEVPTKNVILINFDPKGDEDIGIVETFEKVEEVIEPIIVKEIGEVVESGEEVVEDVVGITGKAVGNAKGVLSSKTTYYVIAGIVVVLILAFVINTKRKNMGSGNFKIIKSSDEGKLADAEDKLNSARKELDEIKNNKRKLLEAKDRFRKDQEELERLEKN